MGPRGLTPFRFEAVGNAAIVQRLFDLFNEGRIDDGRELLHSEIEWLEPPETIGRNVVTGPDAALAGLENWNEQFDSLRAETTELRESGDRVLHAMKQYVRGRGSEIEIEAPLFMVWWFRNGKAARMEMYNTREQAEAAFQR